MQKIQMVDLQSQYLKIKSEIDTAVHRVLDSTHFINGEDVALFQTELANYTGSKHVVGCANGTDALQIALAALGLKPGDEVITPSFTFIATAEAIALLGMKPVFAEVKRDTFVIDTEYIEKLITPKTKAIIPVHLFGQCADMEEILKIAKRNRLFVIEDAAQAIAAEFTFSDGTKKSAGTMGDIGITSFFPSKNLGCYGDGGALFTQNTETAERIKSICNHGSKVKYYHNEIGVNSRLDTIQAAVLRVKLKYLPQYIKSRQHAAEYYNQAFRNHENIITPITELFTEHTFHQYTLQTSCEDRDRLKEYLLKKNIPSMIYYPVPIHLQKAFKNLNYKKGDLPVTENLAECVLSLPMHTELNQEQLDYIAENVLNFFEK